MTSPEPETVAQSPKLMRLMGLTRQMLDELHENGLDLAARTRAQTSHDEVLQQLRDLLPRENQRELDELLEPLKPGSRPGSETALRLNEAQLLGWLEGFVQGIEADEAIREVASETERVRQAHARYQADEEPPLFGDRFRYR